MPDDPAPADKLIEVDATDLKAALAFALTHDGRKRYQGAQEIMSTIVAEHLIAHLRRCGFRVMRGDRQPGELGASNRGTRPDRGPPAD